MTHSARSPFNSDSEVTGNALTDVDGEPLDLDEGFGLFDGDDSVLTDDEIALALDG